ncbi:hypothetical protein EDC01DRAFT_683096 [Geopyxis carbonaria]|nr:hypothetical protein EDC01DRAFT_683096 [Geopyxis carbonaria]
MNSNRTFMAPLSPSDIIPFIVVCFSFGLRRYLSKRNRASQIDGSRKRFTMDSASKNYFSINFETVRRAVDPALEAFHSSIQSVQSSWIWLAELAMNRRGLRTLNRPSADLIHASGDSSPKNSVSGPECFRVMNVPSTWNKDDLLESLRRLDKSWDGECRISLYPSCRSADQIALLNMESYPAMFRDIEREDSMPIRVTDRGAEQMFMLSVDSNFFDLTPLNDPKGDIIADVVAVTGLAGHAYSSWQNRRSQQMWLQDFLPNDVKNIRVMTYGYDTEFFNSADNSAMVDFRKSFVQQLEVARNSDEARNRPLIFVGHSLGGSLILQLLMHSRNSKLYKHILNATCAIFLFGVADQGLRTEQLDEMVLQMGPSGRDSRAQLRLLRLLKENSDFLTNQKEDLMDIWEGRKIFSFYQTVNNIPSQLYLSNEIRIPIRGNHTQMVQFSTKSDSAYQVFLRHIQNCVAELGK